MAKQYIDENGLLYLATLIKGDFAAKESGKGLSANDFTDTLKNKLDAISAGANKVEASSNGKIKIDNTDTTVYTLPKAASGSYGGVKVGSNITVSDGVISLSASNVTAALGYTPVTSTELSNAIANAGHLKRAVVSALPITTEADVNTIYMLVNSNPAEGDNYTEWMLVNGNWEKLGGSSVDLSGYVKASDLVAITNEQIEAAFHDS